jgi:hypothetical protein
VAELAALEAHDERMSTMYRDFGTKLVGLDSLGDSGQSLMSRIKVAARKVGSNTGLSIVCLNG